jgi:hypothetical protein
MHIATDSNQAGQKISYKLLQLNAWFFLDNDGQSRQDLQCLLWHISERNFCPRIRNSFQRLLSEVDKEPLPSHAMHLRDPEQLAQ